MQHTLSSQLRKTPAKKTSSQLRLFLRKKIQNLQKLRNKAQFSGKAFNKWIWILTIKKNIMPLLFVDVCCCLFLFAVTCCYLLSFVVIFCHLLLLFNIFNENELLQCSKNTYSKFNHPTQNEKNNINLNLIFHRVVRSIIIINWWYFVSNFLSWIEKISYNVRWNLSQIQ